jgi:hypothetical protein
MERMTRRSISISALEMVGSNLSPMTHLRMLGLPTVFKDNDYEVDWTRVKDYRAYPSKMYDIFYIEWSEITPLEDYDDYQSAIDDAHQMLENMRLYGTIDKPKGEDNGSA